MTGYIFLGDIWNFMDKIFACDIDGTIYFEDTSLPLLQKAVYEISRQCTIVFNTSRSFQEFKSLGLQIAGKGYVISDSGRSIYQVLGNSVDLNIEWENICLRTAMHDQTIRRVLLGKEFIQNIKCVYPWYIHIDFTRPLTDKEKLILSETCQIYDYKFSYDEEKIGKALHKQVSKKTALLFLASQSNSDLSVGAGNNLVDLPFVEICRKGIMVTSKIYSIPTNCQTILPSKNVYMEVFRIARENM